MGALTQDRKTPYRQGEIFQVGVAASTKIFAGSLVALNASGYAVPAANTAGLKVIGRAEAYVDNSAGANDALKLDVREGVFQFASASLTVADIGDPVYVTDDQTVTKTSASNSVCAGVLVAIDSATVAWVDTRQAQKRMAQYQADSTAADVATMKTDFNALLAKLRAAGLMAGA